MLTLRKAKFVTFLATADVVICDHAVRLSHFGMLITLLNYSSVSSTKFEYIALEIICKDKAKRD